MLENEGSMLQSARDVLGAPVKLVGRAIEVCIAGYHYAVSEDGFITEIGRCDCLKPEEPDEEGAGSQ